MKKRYYSRIGPSVYIPLIIVLGITSVIMILEKQYFPILINVFILFFISHTAANTWYEIESGILTVKCGFLYLKKIKITEIKSIMPTRNPISAPAFSLDRLEIRLEKFESILISPIQKEAFIQELMACNPEITLKH